MEKFKPVKKIILTLILSLTLARGLAPAVPDWLDVWYDGYNVALFGNELPNDVMIDHDNHNDSQMAVTIPFILDGVQHYRLSFNKKYEPAAVEGQMNLLHEMCHIRLYIEKEEELDIHGPKWQSCMHHVADQRGFDPLW